MKKLNRLGFTLVELVLVISIVVVLSVISGPIYRSYAYKARQAEGHALIGTIRSAQENYYGEYGTFLLASDSSGYTSYYTCNEEVLGIDARPNKYYTCFAVTLNPSTAHFDIGPGWYKYCFVAVVKGVGAANLTMLYNRTSGITMFSGVGEAE